MKLNKIKQNENKIKWTGKWNEIKLIINNKNEELQKI